jgi:hypothetical protein
MSDRLGMGDWTPIDVASNQALILSAYRSGRINGAQAWELFTKNNLWNDKEEAFYHYVNGLETFETQKELWHSTDRFKKATRRLLAYALEKQFVSPASEDWLRDLFGLTKEDTQCVG